MFKFSEQDLLPKPTRNDVYEYCDHYDMFRYYIGEFKLGKPIRSPLWEERVPSFAVYVKNGTVLYNDFRHTGGDIINFVQIKFGLSYQEAINKIMQDAGFSNKFNTELTYVPKPIIRHSMPLVDTKAIIKVKRRNWLDRDTQFWSQFGVIPEVLSRYRVISISHIFINNKIYKADTHAYAFIEMKDGIVSYTIYQPYSKTMKWIKSHDASVFYGWTQLSETGDTLILTKSMKDVMTIKSLTDYDSVALQNEKIKPKPHVLDILKSRFKEVILLYDNDYNKDVNYGRVFGKEIASNGGILQAEIPDTLAESYNAKDISDFAKNASTRQAKAFLENIKNYII